MTLYSKLDHIISLLKAPLSRNNMLFCPPYLLATIQKATLNAFLPSQKKVRGYLHQSSRSNLPYLPSNKTEVRSLKKMAKEKSALSSSPKKELETTLNKLNVDQSLVSFPTYPKSRVTRGLFHTETMVNETTGYFAAGETKIQKENYFLDHYLSSNQGTCITQRPAITQGEWVQKGDFLCDTTASALGELAVGKNIAIAYMPWHGYNFEDAILLNETLIINDTYTSLHLEKFNVEIQNTNWGPEVIKKPSDNPDNPDFPNLNNKAATKQPNKTISLPALRNFLKKQAFTFIANQTKAALPFLLYSSNPKKDLGFSLVDSSVSPKFFKLGWFNSMFPPINQLKDLDGPQKKRTPITKSELNVEAEKRILHQFFKKEPAKLLKLSCRLFRYQRRLPARPLSLPFLKRHLVRQQSCNRVTALGTAPSSISQQGLTWAQLAFGKEQLRVGRRIQKKQMNKSEFSNFFQTYCAQKKPSRKKLFYKLQKIEKKQNLKIRYGYVHKKEYHHLDSNGIVKIGTWVQPGDMLVSKFTPTGPKNTAPIEKLVAAIFKKKFDNFKKSGFHVPKDIFGRVVATRLLEPKNLGFDVDFSGVGHVELYIVDKRRIYIGDKMAGRHGNKGIISNILPRQDMPYLPDGTPIDMVLNPLGVPSRMNLGQVFETLLGLAGYHLKQNYKVSPFDEIYGPEASRSLTYSKLYEARLKTGQKWLFQPDTPGKTRLFDGQTGLNFDQSVTAGYAYMLKLIHLVDHKIHARSTGPYALITQQPVRGRSQNGGQRLGEMEFWALEAFGASYNLQEMMTLKSDDIIGRAQVFDSILNLKPITLGPPEAFRVFINELRSLGINFKKQIIHNSKLKKFKNLNHTSSLLEAPTRPGSEAAVKQPHVNLRLFPPRRG